MRNRHAVTVLTVLLLVMSLSACGSVTATPVSQAPAPGPVDAKLFKIQPLAILRSVPGGAACVEGTLGGSSSSTGGNGTFHALSDFTCQRVGNDREVYFAFADAYAAALRTAGATVSGGWSSSGDATQPMEQGWDVVGNTRAGAARLIAENGVGTLRLFISLDLRAP